MNGLNAVGLVAEVRQHDIERSPSSLLVVVFLVEKPHKKNCATFNLVMRTAHSLNGVNGQLAANPA